MPTYEQPGKSTYQDKTGRKTFTISYLGDTVASAPSLSGAALSSVTTVAEVAGTIRTTYQYDLTQAGSGGTAGSSSYLGLEFAGSLRTVPLAAHPRYKNLTAEEQKEVRDFVQNPISGSKALPAAWSTFAGVTSMSELAEKMLSGQESYYEPGVILRKTYASSSIPGADKLGRIKSPGVTYPALPTGANWLLVSLSVRGTSGTYTVVEEYELSGEGGWDPDLYS